MKRSPHTDALDTLGTIHQYQEMRDAIHLAVEPVEAGEPLNPGDRIFWVDGLAYKGDHDDKEVLGIVDPFLTVPVNQGDRFWMVLNPGIVRSLRHVWEHPDIPLTGEMDRFSKIKDAESWLQDFCKNNDCPRYDEMLSIAQNLAEGVRDTVTEKEFDRGDGEILRYLEGWALRDDHLLLVGMDGHAELPMEFWLRMEEVIGKKLPTTSKVSSLACTC